eukprot:8531192-Pyramimonas_sp.AAC.1
MSRPPQHAADRVGEARAAAAAALVQLAESQMVAGAPEAAPPAAALPRPSAMERLPRVPRVPQAETLRADAASEAVPPEAAPPTAAPPTAMQRVQRVQPTTDIQAADGAVRLLKQQLSRVEA